MEQPGRTARVRKGSHTVPWVEESNPGLGLQPSGARTASLPSEEVACAPRMECQLPGLCSLVAGIPLCLRSPGAVKKVSLQEFLSQ